MKQCTYTCSRCTSTLVGTFDISVEKSTWKIESPKRKNTNLTFSKVEHYKILYYNTAAL